MDMDKKRELDTIAQTYDPSSPDLEFDYWFVRFGFETIVKFLRGPRVLELGCSTGLMTSLLAQAVSHLVVVEGSTVNIAHARSRVGEAPHVTFIHELWEKFVPEEKYDDIIFAGALEHVDRPVKMLKRVASWLAPGGRLHIIVPNAYSLHRRIGVKMGLLNNVHDLHEGDRRIGHKRVYNRELLFYHINQAGLKVYHWEGIMLKPLSNEQMKSWPESLIRALYEIGHELPDYCGQIYACCIIPGGAG